RARGAVPRSPGVDVSAPSRQLARDPPGAAAAGTRALLHDDAAIHEAPRLAAVPQEAADDGREPRAARDPQLRGQPCPLVMAYRLCCAVPYAEESAIFVVSVA